MKRLRDMGGDPLHDRAATLLRAVEPRPEPSERIARIRQAIAIRPLTTRKRRVKPALWIGAGFFVAAAAAAATGRFRAPASSTPGAPSADVVLAPAPDERPKFLSPPLASAARAARHAVKVPPRASGSALASANRSARGPNPRGADDEQAPEPDSSSRAAAAALVQSAVVALRRERDPDKAKELLDRYTSRDPKGPLAEEAIALQIEAATARRDPAARSLAREYLSRYPDGRYRQVARQALATQR